MAESNKEVEQFLSEVEKLEQAKQGTIKLKQYLLIDLGYFVSPLL